MAMPRPTRAKARQGNGSLDRSDCNEVWIPFFYEDRSVLANDRNEGMILSLGKVDDGDLVRSVVYVD